MRDLERVFVFAFNGENRWPGYMRPLPHVIESDFTLGETTLTPLPVQHGRTRVNGYLLARRGIALVAYLSDCKVVPEPVIERIAGVRYLIVDALRHKLHPTHMSVSEALELAEKVAPERTWLTHLCHELKHAELEPALPENVRIAYDGLRLEV